MPMDLEASKHYISQALQHGGGTHTLDDVLAGIEAGRLQLWPGANSALVTSIVEWPQKKTLFLFLYAGNLAELEAMLPFVEEWGKAQGCTDSQFIGRTGWTRTFLTRTGWETKKLAVMEKTL